MDIKQERLKIVQLDEKINSMQAMIDDLNAEKRNSIQKIQSLTESYKQDINSVSKFLNIPNVYNIENNTAYRPYTYAIGNPPIRIKTNLYTTRKFIPIGEYGVVVENDNHMMLYRYNKSNYVSCSDIYISADSNHRSICCNNLKCRYGDDCKYYHDPAIVKGSEHIQQFLATGMVKSDKMFGDSELVFGQIQNLKFSDVRTLARYCSVMMLFIKQIK